MHSFSVLFVCTANICRSPTAHGVFRQRVARAGLARVVHIDSAGTHGHSAGERADARAQAYARQRGYVLADLKSRPLLRTDFHNFDLLLAMDHDNMAHLKARCPLELQEKLRCLTEFSRHHPNSVVPDPYYGNAAGFEHVLDVVEDACEGLLAHVQQQLSTAGVSC